MPPQAAIFFSLKPRPKKKTLPKKKMAPPSPMERRRGPNLGENTSKSYVYHYTTISALRKILDTKVLRASEDQLTDSSLGRGVYFTRMRPNSSDSRLLTNNWNGAQTSTSRLRAYVGVRVEDLGRRLHCMDTERSVCVVKGNFRLPSKFTYGTRVRDVSPRKPTKRRRENRDVHVG